MKKYSLLLMILVLLTITGCGSQGFTGGPNGVQINFILDGFPIDQNTKLPSIPQGSPPTVKLTLTNNAACDVSGKLWLDDSIQGGIEKPISQNLDLYGESLVNNKLEIDHKDFLFGANQIPAYQNIPNFQSEVTLIATAVYSCSINTGPQLCIKKESASNSIICANSETITGSKLNAASAPVTLTEIRKSYYADPSGGTKLHLDITLSKMSDGRVSNTAALQDPFTLESVKEEDSVNVEVEYANIPMECSDKNKHFKDGKLSFGTKPEDSERTINCEVLVTDFKEFSQDQLNVKLDFIYKITKTQNILITS